MPVSRTRTKPKKAEGRVMTRTQIRRNVRHLHALAQQIETPQQFEDIMRTVQGSERMKLQVRHMLIPMLPFKVVDSGIADPKPS